MHSAGSKISNKMKTKAFQLRIKQHAFVLDYITAIQDELRQRHITKQAISKALRKPRTWVSKAICNKPDLTFFTAVEIADALGLDVKVQVERRNGNK